MPFVLSDTEAFSVYHLLQTTRGRESDNARSARDMIDLELRLEIFFRPVALEDVEEELPPSSPAYDSSSDDDLNECRKHIAAINGFDQLGLISDQEENEAPGLSEDTELLDYQTTRRAIFQYSSDSEWGGDPIEQASDEERIELDPHRSVSYLFYTNTFRHGILKRVSQRATHSHNKVTNPREAGEEPYRRVPSYRSEGYVLDEDAHPLENRPTTKEMEKLLLFSFQEDLAAAPEVEYHLGVVEDSHDNQRRNRRTRQQDPRPFLALPIQNTLTTTLATVTHSSFESVAVPSMAKFLSGESWTQNHKAFENHSVISTFERCDRAEELEVGLEFVAMVDLILFVASVQAEKSALASQTITSVLKHHFPTKLSIAKKRLAAGTKLISIASAGTVYLLMVMAMATQKKDLLKLTGDMIPPLCNAIRNPDLDTAMGRQIASHLVPALAYLRVVFPLWLPTLLSPQAQVRLNIPAQIDCANLEASDRFFSSFPLQTMVGFRNTQTWAPLCAPPGTAPAIALVAMQKAILGTPMEQEPFSSASPLSEIGSDEEGSPPKSSHLPAHVILTNFDPQKDENKFPFKHRSNHRNVYKWTEKQRKTAEHAKIPSDMEEAKRLIQTSLTGGFRKKDSPYVKLSSEVLETPLQMNDAAGELVFFASSSMPEHLRSRMLGTMEMIFPDYIVDHDTKGEETTSRLPVQFESIHMDWWNRYSTVGDGTPSNVHPSNLSCEGKGPLRETALLPRAAKELQDFREQYYQLQIAFHDVFEWVREELETSIPEELQLLNPWVDVLPNNDTTLAWPFSGFVLNFNVTTRGHRDWKDDQICVILVLSDCEGGELVLYEPGVILALDCGGIVAFTSGSTTHFNLHFKGKRASVVLHSDASGARWGIDRNGWNHSEHMAQGEEI